MILYHASPVPNISVFDAGTHFGTQQSALERSRARKFENRDMYLYTVDLDVHRPLEIFDEGGSHTTEYLVEVIRQADRKAFSAFAADIFLKTAVQDGEKAAIKLMIDTMLAQGRYDCLTYLNNTEGDEEDYSYMIFDGKQARIIACENLQKPQVAFSL